jgi:hypothetical protein
MPLRRDAQLKEEEEEEEEAQGSNQEEWYEELIHTQFVVNEPTASTLK